MSFTLTIPWNLAKLVKIFLGAFVRLHHTDQKQLGLLKEQYAERKKVRLQYCCNQDWMKNGGQIPWNAFPICETFKISCLMGKLHTKGVLENHLKDQSFCLVHWLSITLLLRKMLELFSSRISVDQDLSVIVAEINNDDDVKQRLVPIVFHASVTQQRSSGSKTRISCSHVHERTNSCPPLQARVREKGSHTN